MAGRTHTTRTPHRMNDVLGRDALGFVARQTVATQDLRKAIYVGPYGKGYHRVRNPFSGEVYVVADGLGGATVEPDSVVMVASFSGAHGEVLVTRPPAGFGGAATSTVTRTPYRDSIGGGTVGGGSGDVFAVAGFCWYQPEETAIIARYRDVYVDGVFSESIVDFVKLGIASLPHSDISLGTVFMEVTDRFIQAMRIGPSGVFFVFSTDGPGTVGGTINQIVSKYSYAGQLLAEVNYDANSSAYTYPTVVVGGNLYAVEPKAGVEPGGGPPYDSWSRITKRDGSSLAVSASWDLPNPGSYDGWSLRTSGCEGLTKSGGYIRAFIYHQKQPFGGSDVKMAYQDFDASLTPSGGYVQFSGNPIGGVGDPAFPTGDAELLSTGDLVWRTPGTPYNLYTFDADGEGGAEILSGSLASQGTDFGIKVTTGDKVLVLGDGSEFVTSFISGAGQELP